MGLLDAAGRGGRLAGGLGGEGLSGRFPTGRFPRSLLSTSHCFFGFFERKWPGDEISGIFKSQEIHFARICLAVHDKSV